MSKPQFRPSVSPKSAPPGPPLWQALNSLRSFQRTPLAFLSRLESTYGGVVRFHTGLLPVYFVSAPDGVKQVLQTNARNYSKQTFTYGMVRRLTGENLLTAEGPLWLQRRRLIQPLLHRNHSHLFLQEMSRTIKTYLADWEPGERDLQQSMMALTLAVAGRTLFSVDLLAETAAVRRSLDQGSQAVMQQFQSPLALLWTLIGFPTPGQRSLGQAQSYLDELVTELIAQRRKRGERPEDVLTLLLEAEDAETGEGLSDEAIRSEIAILLIAGHETTALALTWSWILLAQYPEMAERLWAEVETLGHAPTTTADLARLPFTRAIFEETLRLYPPVWGFSRRAVADDTIAGYTIPAGARVMLSPYVTHRSPRYWSKPEQFQPERFLSEEADRRSDYAYWPFGGGPRQCIGSSFALMEGILVLATIARRYRLELVDDRIVRPVVAGTLRPDRPVRMKVVPR